MKMCTNRQINVLNCFGRSHCTCVCGHGSARRREQACKASRHAIANRVPRGCSFNSGTRLNFSYTFKFQCARDKPDYRFIASPIFLFVLWARAQLGQSARWSIEDAANVSGQLLAMLSGIFVGTLFVCAHWTSAPRSQPSTGLPAIVSHATNSKLELHFVVHNDSRHPEDVLRPCRSDARRQRHALSLCRLLAAAAAVVQLPEDLRADTRMRLHLDQAADRRFVLHTRNAPLRNCLPVS